MGVIRYNHTGHCVSDLAIARRFWEELLGFEPILAMPVETDASAKLLRLRPPVAMDVAYLRREGFVLELLHFRSPPAAPHRERTVIEPGLTHVSLTVEDIDEICARVPEYGGTVLAQTRLPGAVMIQDPDGQLVELLDRSSKLLELLGVELPRD